MHLLRRGRGKNRFAVAEGEKMREVVCRAASPVVTIRVSGKLFKDHLEYLAELVQSAGGCGLWPLLDLENLTELDNSGLFYLLRGEGRHFGIVSCPNFIREWMHHERTRQVA